MIAKRANELKDELIKIRHTLHKTPETDFVEFKTSAYIQKKLIEYGIPFEVKAITGISAIIKGKNDGKTVLLRADFDGLPIKEESGVDFSSEIDGYMHACGHDVHAACLLGAAKILNEHKNEISGNIKLIFQPAEEGAGGALPMIEEGVMENPHVDGAFALHVEPLENVGNIQIKDGSVMASPDDFEIIIHGVGGHGAHPEECVNPISVGAEILRKYHTLSSDYKLPCVVTICSFNSGSCRNVIPDTAVITGTARSLDSVTRKKLVELLKKIASDTAADMNASIEFNFNVLFPPVVNNSEMNEIVAESARQLGLNITYLTKPSMAGDDFSYFGERVPSSYFKLGVGNETIGAIYPIHSPKFKADDCALPLGAAIMAQAALNFLNK
ncbi:MAG: M20 family metallopeptidase [Clostridia bacterium]